MYICIWKDGISTIDNTIQLVLSILVYLEHILSVYGSSQTSFLKLLDIHVLGGQLQVKLYTYMSIMIEQPKHSLH